MKIVFNAFERIPPEKIGEAVKAFYEYLDKFSDKLSIQTMSLYVPFKDEDGDSVTLREGGADIYWEVRTEPRKKEGSERSLVYQGEGLYIYRHLSRKN